MLNIKLFDEALKITWIRKYINTSATWKKLLDIENPIFRNIPLLGDKYKNTIITYLSNPFWEDVINYYYRFYNKYKFTSINEVESTSYLFNTKITIGKDVISNKDLIAKEIYYISNFKSNGEFMSVHEFNTKYNTKLNFLQYNSIINSIKCFTRKYSYLKTTKDINYQSPINKILMNKKGASNIYRELVFTEEDITGLSRWLKVTNITNTDYFSAFNILKNTTNDTKLRWLQFRILHYILTTNRSVAKFNKDQDKSCTFCGAHSETILHLMWECNHVKRFWNELSNLINKKCTHAVNFKFTKSLVIFGLSRSVKTDKICNLIILIAKFYIYKSKVQHSTLSIKHFQSELFKRYQIEQIINCNSIKFRTDWAPYLAIFKGLLNV